MTEQVNPYEYAYDKDQIIPINANALINFMVFLEEVIEREPKMGALLVYPEKVDKITDKEGKLIKTDIEWKEHTQDSFFFTAADDNGGVPMMTSTALKANQFLYALTQIHQDNINKKIAKKRTEVNEDRVFES